MRATPRNANERLGSAILDLSSRVPGTTGLARAYLFLAGTAWVLRAVLTHGDAPRPHANAGRF